MESLVQRWKNVLNTTTNQQNSQHQSPKKQTQSEHIMKKSTDSKSKPSLHHSHEKSKSKRMMTPSKKKSKSSKNTTVEKCVQEIMLIIHSSNTDKNIKDRLTHLIQGVWSQAKQHTFLKQSNKMQINADIQQPPTSIHESHASNMTNITAKKHEKLYQDLQKKYFECEKQKHFLKNKIDSLITKYENIDRQLERYAKMQKLVDRSLQRQDQLKDQIKQLNKQLQNSELKNLEQQRLFKKQIMAVYGLMDSIKANLHEI